MNAQTGRGSPRAHGFRMPAEWEPHEATWIAWPHNREDWPGRFAPIPWVYAEIVKRLSAVEKVRILVQNEAAERTARRMLGKVGAMIVFIMWVRWTLPRFRYDTLMDLAWKSLIPLALVNLLATATILQLIRG